jgi:hypothetical protein
MKWIQNFSLDFFFIILILDVFATVVEWVYNFVKKQKNASSINFYTKPKEGGKKTSKL